MPELMNITEMREILTATIRGVKSRRIKPPEAKAIYGGTGQLMASYKLEMEYNKAMGRKLPEQNSFLPAPKKNGKKEK